MVHNSHIHYVIIQIYLDYKVFWVDLWSLTWIMGPICTKFQIFTGFLPVRYLLTINATLNTRYGTGR